MSDSVTEVSEATFQAEVVDASAGKPVLVDFWSPGCGPCIMLAPVLEKIATAQGDASKIVKCNVAENMGLAQKFGITAVPTLIYFKGGEAAQTVRGMQSEGNIVAQLKALAS